MNQNQTFKGLEWLVEEVESSLQAAFEELEAFTQNPDDETKIRFCQSHLHQVAGPFKILECQGASLLAEEMEAVAEAIVAGRVSNVNEACEILAQAIIKLPVYLRQVQLSREDRPEKLILLLNDLRAAQGQPLISEGVLFSPDLSPVTRYQSEALKTGANPAAFVDLVKRLRQIYQVSLIKVIKGEEVAKSYANMAKVLQRLQELTRGTWREQLWHVAKVLLEQISGNHVSFTIALKKLYRALDTQIKQIMQEAASGTPGTLDQALVKNLLYYLTTVKPVSDEQSELWRNFRLVTALPAGAVDPDASNLMPKYDPLVVRSLVSAIQGELNQIRSVLERFMLEGNAFTKEVNDALPILTNMADSLALVGQSGLRTAVTNIARELREAFDAQGELTESNITSAVDQLTEIEISLNAWAANPDSFSGEVEVGAKQHHYEYRAASETLLAEARTAIERIKETVIDFINSQWDFDLLQATPGMLRELAGGLNMIEQTRAASVAASCAEYVQQKLIKERSEVEWQALDTFADAITIVEYYLEQLDISEPTAHEDVLIAAEDSVATLLQLPLPSAVHVPAAADLLAEPEEILEELAQQQEQQVQEPVMVQPVESADSEEDEEADEEIVEIFLEEAEEVQQTIREFLPQWLSQPPALPALTELRRAFHTLKGSGRMVNADEVGELAWAVEDMLNRLIDGRISRTPVMEQLIEQVVAGLPTMLAAFAANMPDPKAAEHMALAAAAQRLAKGETLRTDDLLPQPMEEPAEVVAEESEAEVVALAEERLEGQSPVTEGQSLTELDLSVDITPEADLTLEVEAQASEAPASAAEPDIAEIDLTLQADEIDLQLEEPEEPVSTELEDISGEEIELVDVVSEVSGEEPLEPLDELAIDIDLDAEIAPAYDISEYVSEESAVPEQPESLIELSAADELMPEPELQSELVAEELAALTRVEPDLDLGALESDTAELDVVAQESVQPDLDAAEVEVDETLALIDTDALLTDEAESELDEDEELWQTFAGEAKEHLATIEGYLGERLSNIPEPPNSAVLRALHTLKGSSAMAGIEAIHQLVLPVEQFAKTLFHHQVNVSDGMAALLARTVELTNENITALVDGRPLVGGAEEIESRVAELREQLLEQPPERTGEPAVDPAPLRKLMAEGLEALQGYSQRFEQLAAGSLSSDALGAEFSRELVQVKEAAVAAKLQPIVDTSEQLLAVYSAGAAVTAAANLRTLQTAHEALLGMFDMLAAEQYPGAMPTQLRGELEQLVEQTENDQLVEADSSEDLQATPEWSADIQRPAELAVAMSATEYVVEESQESGDVEMAAMDQAEEISADVFDLGDMIVEDGFVDFLDSEVGEPQPALEAEAEAEAEAEDDTELFDRLAEFAQNLQPDFAAAAIEQDEEEDSSPTPEEALAEHEVELEEWLPESDIADVLDEAAANLGVNVEESVEQLQQAELDSAADDEQLFADLAEATRQLQAEHAADADQLPLEDAEESDFALDDVLEMDHGLEAGTEPETDDFEGVTVTLEGVDDADVQVDLDSVEDWQMGADLAGESEPAAEPFSEADKALDDAGDFDGAVEGAVEGALEEDAPADVFGEVEPETVVGDEAGAAEYIPAVQEMATAAEETSMPAAPLAEQFVDDDADQDIVGIFVEEAEDIMNSLEEALHGWRTNPTQMAFADQLKRDLHTFKGGARMAGFNLLGSQAHEMESQIMLSGKSPDNKLFKALGEFQERLASGYELARKMAAGESRESINQQYAELQRQVAGAVDEQPPSATSMLDLSEFEQKIQADQAPAVVEPPQADLQPGGLQGEIKEVVRISADALDTLVNLSGENIIFRGRVEEQVSEFGQSLQEMEETITRLQEQVRRLDIETEAQIDYRREQIEASGTDDFDPLEMDRYSQLQQLARGLSESASDLLDLKDTLFDRLGGAEAMLLHQSRINTDLQEGLMKTRMVPFSRVVPRLRRIVRQVSQELGKDVQLRMDNIQGEMDRSMLDRLLAPLEHMLRNAIDHGIENSEQRRAAGKPSAGTITITAFRKGGDIVVRLADDGRGLNIARIRQRAIEKGLLTEGVEISDHQLSQFIFHPGFSTSEAVTHISGRGVGMDVVSSEVRQMGGSVDIESTPGLGAQFTVVLPFTLSVNRALMIGVGSDRYALSLSTIEGVHYMRPAEVVAAMQQGGLIRYADEDYEVGYLGTLLDPTVEHRIDREVESIPFILFRADNRRFAVQVDEVAGTQEIVVKSLGIQFSVVPGLGGATILSDGSVVVIIDLNELARAALVHLPAPDRAAAMGASEQTRLTESSRPEVPTVMVVDDSVTVRKVTSRLLKRQGYRVLTAKDGMDGLKQIQEDRPDVILLDIEMPRMDGFEMARRVRDSDSLRGIPIIMITSRTGEKHRERAMELGVKHYMGKPYQEDQLLHAIERQLNGEVEGDA